MADALAALVSHIKSGPWRVYAEMPHNFELKSLPAINVVQVGPSARSPALNGLGVDWMDYDCDLYVDHAQWASGQAQRLADQLRQHLTRLHSDGVRFIDASRPAKRPDRNSTIRRLSVTVTVAAPA